MREQKLWKSSPPPHSTGFHAVRYAGHIGLWQYNDATGVRSSLLPQGIIFPEFPSQLSILPKTTAAVKGHSFFKRKHWNVKHCLKRCCAFGLNYRSVGSTIFIGGPIKPVPTSQKTHIFSGLLEPRSQPEYMGKHTDWSGICIRNRWPFTISLFILFYFI